MKKVLKHNSIQCLMCNTILVSKYRHNYVSCQCDNQAFCDGGIDYMRYGAVDMTLIKDLSVYQEMTDDEYEAYKHELKIQRNKQQNNAIDRFLMYTANLPIDKG